MASPPSPHPQATAPNDRSSGAGRTARGAQRPAAPTWQFTAHFRRGQYGWRSAKLAAQRLDEARREIEARGRSDPAGAAEGAVRLIERLVPALEHVDDSSGVLGTAVRHALEALTDVVAAATDAVPERTYSGWLDRLWEAHEEDGMPYLESIGSLWGRLCATPERASAWADTFLPLVRMVFAERRKGAYGVAKATMGCLSALLAAGRTDDLLALLDADDMKFWPYRRLGVEALLARGDRAAALRYAEASRTPQRYNDAAIDQACASILVASGLTEEAYQRYGLTAHTRSTNLATYRATVKAFPSIPKDRVLADLIASRPGEEGKWFAAAKSTGDLTLALRLAETSPVDIRTLLRASRDHQNAAPDFAVGTALAAMRWMCAAQFYELTGADVHGAVTLALSAATHASAWTVAEVLRRMQDLIRDDASPKQFVRMVAEGRLREIAATTTSISVTNAPD